MSDQPGRGLSPAIMCCSLGHEDVPAYYVGDFEVERDHVEPGVPYCKPCGDNASRMGDYGITGVIGVTWTPQEDAIQQALYALGDHYAPTSATQNVTDAASVYAALRKAGYVLLRMGNLPPDLKVILEDDDLSAPARVQSEPCCEYGPPGHTQQQHHDASACFDQACPFDHPHGGPYPHPCDVAGGDG